MRSLVEPAAALRSTGAANSYSEIWSQFLNTLEYENIPSEVTSRTSIGILDTVGCVLGSVGMDWIDRINTVAKAIGGPPEATILGDGARVGVASAALANGAMGRGLDMDDTHLRPWGHLSACVVPTAFSVGEWLEKSGKEVITACIGGFELACRFGISKHRGDAFMHVSRTLFNEPSPNRSEHVFAATAVAGKLMDLPVGQMTSAFGLSAGLKNEYKQTHVEKAQAMPLDQGGWPVHAGVIAAMLGKAGLVGPRFILEGTHGVLAGLDEASAGADLPLLIAGLGTEWEAHRGTFKLYPSGHGTHYFINSVNSLLRDGVAPDDIKTLVCYVPQTRYEAHFSPESKAYTPSPYDARFSLPFLLATTLRTGTVTPASFSEECVSDKVTLELARRVVPLVDEEAWLPENRGHVMVTLSDGTTLERKTPHSTLPGTPEQSVPMDLLRRKFRANVSSILSSTQTGKLWDALIDLENVENIGEVIRLTVPGR